jgi:pimeloyl-ACP methyl ester carboxylesterase
VAFSAHQIQPQELSVVTTTGRAPLDSLDTSFGDASTGPLLQSAVSPWSVPGSVSAWSVTSDVAAWSVTDATDAAVLPRLTGVALLDQLSLLPRDDLARFVSHNPSAMKQLVASPPTAREVTTAWAKMGSQGRASWIAVAPGVIGNLEGVPFGARDAANRSYLRETIAELKSGIKSGIGRGELDAARARLRMLEQVQDALATPKSANSATPAQARHLLSLDPSGVGRAAVVVGDLSTADYVSYLVPGMFFTVDGQMVDWTVIAQDLNTEQTNWVSLLSKTDPSLAGKKVATVAWIGYQTPGITGITSLGLAHEGADALGSSIEGLQANRAGDEPFVTIVGHSYGSTAAMIELAKGGVSVDALVLIGSPGSAAQSASELSVRNDNVYVGEAAWDPVVNTAFYGSDPGAPSFGARTMNVSGGVDPITHKQLAPAIGHLGYFDAGTEAMRNIALISLDRDSLVTNGTTMDASRTLR